MSKPHKKHKKVVIVYLEGDKDKKPVDASAQKAGTRLVMVTPKGRDIPFIQGSVRKADPTKQKERFAKALASKQAKINSEG